MLADFQKPQCSTYHFLDGFLNSMKTVSDLSTYTANDGTQVEFGKQRNIRLLRMSKWQMTSSIDQVAGRNDR